MHRANCSQIVSIGSFVLASLLFSGCRMAELTPQGAEVATSQSAPVDSGWKHASCRSLGYLVGRGGGTGGGAYISNEQLVEFAMNDLRNKAAGLGANFIQHDSPQLGVSGGDGGSVTSTATVSGTAYLCTEKQSEEQTLTPAAPIVEAAETPAVKSVAIRPESYPAPEGVAGFRFGQHPSELESLCTQAKHTFSKEDASFTCSGAAIDLGMPADVTLGMCNDALCRIEVRLRPAPEDYAAGLKRVFGELQKRYGSAVSKDNTTKECRTKLAECVQKDEVKVAVSWRWNDRHRVTLRSASDDQGAHIYAIYMSPQALDPAPVAGPAF